MKNKKIRATLVASILFGSAHCGTDFNTGGIGDSGGSGDIGDVELRTRDTGPLKAWCEEFDGSTVKIISWTDDPAATGAVLTTKAEHQSRLTAVSDTYGAFEDRFLWTVECDLLETEFYLRKKDSGLWLSHRDDLGKVRATACKNDISAWYPISRNGEHEFSLAPELVSKTSESILQVSENGRVFIGRATDNPSTTTSFFFDKLEL